MSDSLGPIWPGERDCTRLNEFNCSATSTALERFEFFFFKALVSKAALKKSFSIRSILGQTRRQSVFETRFQ